MDRMSTALLSGDIDRLPYALPGSRYIMYKLYGDVLGQR